MTTTMTTIEHTMTRNEANEPVCGCGFRPDILDSGAPVGVAWKAKRDVLNHVVDLTSRPRSASSPFEGGPDRRYPRAGVRPLPSGRWLLTLWDAPDVVHHIDAEDQEYTDMQSALDYGNLRIGACRRAGTDLSGRPTTGSIRIQMAG